MGLTVEYIKISLQIVTAAGIILALFQLLEVRRKRHIDMFWKIYESYTSADQKLARKNTVIIRQLINEKINEGLSKTDIIEFYSATYHLTKKTDNKELDRSVIDRIRFLNQIGQLLKKKMIDKEMVFELVGLGLEHDYQSVSIIIETHRRDHQAPMMYSSFEETYNQYQVWKKSKSELRI